jgi:hypothetical protein
MGMSNKEFETVFAWVRNRSAAGRGSDPMPVILHDDVGLAGLEIVATHRISVGPHTIDYLVSVFPAPEVERL